MVSKFRIAIAIDFGTARSGYAAKFFGEEFGDKDIIFCQQWPDSGEFYIKTLTEILFRPDGSVEAWGHTAKKRFSELKERAEEKGYIFIDNFKTQLHEGRDRDTEGIYITKEGKKFYVIYLISEFLKRIKEKALEDIAKQLGDKLAEEQIRWCLTVPAVWQENSKQLMRRAAQMAGLIGDGTEEAERLLLVLEPEAAAVECQRELIKQKEAELGMGKVIMIVDAGGGTVDITVHEVARDGLEELIPSGGGLHGSKYVDKSFREFLDRKLSPEVMNEFQAEWPVEYTKLMGNTWESIKCGYNPNPDWIHSIDLPNKLEKIIERKRPDILEDLANTQNGDNEVVKLINEDMECIFKPVVDQLIARVKEQFVALGDRQCDVLFLVGGFAVSPLLQNRIREEFAGKVAKIVIPNAPGAAVLFGAASFGVNPNAVVARRSKLTFGVANNDLFEEGVDEEPRRIKKEVMNAGLTKQLYHSDFCSGRFEPFVVAKQPVRTNARVPKLFSVFPYQTEVKITLLATPSTEVRYSDEPGVREVGTMTIQLPFAPEGNTLKPVEVDMQFGGSEVVVYIIDPISGNRERGNFDFSYDN